MTGSTPTRASVRGDATAPYENPALPVAERVEDLLQRMTLEEKAGLMFQTMAMMGENGKVVTDASEQPFGRLTVDMMDKSLMNHFNLLGGSDPVEIANWYNAIQERAMKTRLGIPVSLSTDPRHHFTDNIGASVLTAGFTQFPETLGLAALRDAKTVEEFAEVARREYVATGIRVALHPQIDLATSPLWARQNGTFGENAELTGELVAAYIRGFGGDNIGAESVSTMVKHFPGGGPQQDGLDPHFPYGREQEYPGNQWDLHLAPFKKALEAGCTQMMPYYGMPVGTDREEVAFGFNRGVITGLLREELGFDGIVCTDWGLITDANIMGAVFPRRAWGVEHLKEIDLVEKVINAGCDQFGGEACPEYVIELVNTGRVDESRIDVSVRRLLKEKFNLGLFDNPFVDAAAAADICGTPESRAFGHRTQSRSVTVLTNGADNTPVLPLAEGVKVYLQGVDAEVAAGYGQVVATPAEADVAIMRLRTPYEPRETFFEGLFHDGSLEFSDEDKAKHAETLTAVPTVVDIYLERPAVIPELVEGAAALVANYGASDAALLDALFGRIKPEGKLPFQLPGSMTDARAQRVDVPSDSKDALFEYGHGLSV